MKFSQSESLWYVQRKITKPQVVNPSSLRSFSTRSPPFIKEYIVGSRFEREAIIVDVERVLILLKCDIDKDFARREGCSKGKRKKVGRVTLG
jgi:hypothetical protein